MADTQAKTNETVLTLQRLANLLRIHSIESTQEANSGHPTSCSSMAEIITVLFFNVMRYDVKEPRHPASDRFVLSKGHCAPILYAAWAEAGAFPTSDLKNLRKIDSDLEGHPTPRLNFIDVATGSLGQGIGFASGMAYAGKYLDKSDYRVYCVLGDGECAEGSVWEAFSFASFYKLDNLCAIIDINRLGQSDPTQLQHDLETYRKRADAFGWHPIAVDGQNVDELLQAFKEAAETKNRPTCILAKTFKGSGLKGIENELDWHGKPLGDKGKDIVESLKKLINGDIKHPQLAKITAKVSEIKKDSEIKLSSPPNYDGKKEIATRLAHGTALEKLGKSCKYVVALDGDTKNSTYSQKFRDSYPDRFVECYIAEQNMVAVAIGIATRDRYICFVHTFAAFLTRTFDQIRMGAISFTKVKFVGSHAGISIGEDGPSQMGLEDFAMFRSVPQCVCFYPSDPVSAERAVELAANYDGMVYIRTSRPNTATLYKNDELFQIGKAKIIIESSQDICTIISGGVTLHEAIKASEKLKQAGKVVRVIDLFTVKPIDRDTLLASAKATHGRLIVVEDHYPEGGLGEAVMSALCGEEGIKIVHLAVREIARSGKPAELLSKYGIDSEHITKNMADEDIIFGGTSNDDYGMSEMSFANEYKKELEGTEMHRMRQQQEQEQLRLLEQQQQEEVERMRSQYTILYPSERREEHLYDKPKYCCAHHYDDYDPHNQHKQATTGAHSLKENPTSYIVLGSERIRQLTDVYRRDKNFVKDEQMRIKSDYPKHYILKHEQNKPRNIYEHQRTQPEQQMCDLKVKETNYDVSCNCQTPPLCRLFQNLVDVLKQSIEFFLFIGYVVRRRNELLYPYYPFDKQPKYVNDHPTFLSKTYPFVRKPNDCELQKIKPFRDNVSSYIKNPPKHVVNDTCYVIH
ncbi:unnamed protein product [Didymodactylos carnosus]|uniref:transketolase n=1 Tax=Didymodactylos carnosus TaxID=1234261 RepID=A0A814V2H8_9BILA|nr:unnamed protein product [Didymodactylos carnosus]CAF1183206.1 unnamed protein product [Didymodactylos carnosus]CAF3754745.1 unnamed protein product [Didymodactylos carnosus]CAF3947523.1 unnamed protein product [Didymodactylos carnosus]